MKKLFRKIFNKSLARETIKLMFQNAHAILYLSNFMGDEFPEALSIVHARLQERYIPGEPLDDDGMSSALEINRSLRNLYSAVPGILRPKSFDEEYSPLLGWPETFHNYNL